MSTKAQLLLGATAEELQSRPPSRPASRNSSRRFRSARSSVSQLDRSLHIKNTHSYSERTSIAKSPLASFDNTQNNYTQQQDLTTRTKARESWIAPMTFSHSGRATRRSSPTRAATFNWPLPVLSSKTRGSWMLNQTTHASNLRGQLQNEPTATSMILDAGPPVQTSEKQSLRKQLSKLSLKSKKSQDNFTSAFASGGVEETSEPVPALPEYHAPSQPISSKPSAHQSTRNSVVEPEKPKKQKKRRAKQKPKYWWDRFEEDMVSEDVSYDPEAEPERPETPQEVSSAVHTASPFSQSSQVERHIVVSNEDGDADTLQGLLPATGRPVRIENMARGSTGVSTPRKRSPHPSHKVSTNELGSDTKQVRRMPSKSTIAGSIQHGTSVLSLSDSDDSDVESNPQLNALKGSPEASPKVRRRHSRQRSRKQTKRFPKPFNPEAFRNAVLPELDESVPTTSSSTVPSTYLAESGDESSDSQNSPPSPIIVDSNPNSRDSWMSGSSNFFPAPPNGRRNKRQVPFSKGSPEGPYHSRAALYAPISLSSPYTRHSAQSGRSTTHHLMTVTAEEAMLLSSMRKKRASMQQQLFSEGYRSALQEELRIMETLRVDDLPPTPPADITSPSDLRAGTSHSAPAGRIETLRHLERGRDPEVKRATSASELQTPHVPGTVAAELAALDQLIEAEAEAEAEAGKISRAKSAPASASPPSVYLHSSEDGFTLQSSSSSEDTVVLASASEDADSPGSSYMARDSDSRDFAEPQSSASLEEDSSAHNEEDNFLLEPQTNDAESERPRSAVLREKPIPRPIVANEAQLTRLPSRSKSAGRRASKIPRSVQQQHQWQSPSNNHVLRPLRDSAMSLATADRSSGGSVTRDLIAAWNDLGGTKSAINFGTISSAA